MTRRMTIVFDDEELYTALKVEAARAHRPAKDIVADALQIFFEATEDEHDRILTRSRMRSFVRQGGADVERVLEELGLAKDRGANVEVQPLPGMEDAGSR
jgi:plasmid stability protein